MTFSPRVDALLEQLTLEERISLLAGVDMWHTAAIEHAGVPALRVTDGPAGARGTNFEGGPASVNVPCATALAATWDPLLVEHIGALLGQEVRAKGARVHLAPTVNLHRTPTGGRNFECFSEDPQLTSAMAVAYVRGVQSQGVASCVKHFVGNDTEFERNTIDSQIDERTLRELYLAPFEAAVKRAGAHAVMTAYNRINGPWSADSDELLDRVLRGDWAFDGLVMSDWFGLHSTVAGLLAGCDLEMPGPTLHRGPRLAEAVAAGDVPADAVRRAAGRVLQLLERTGALDGDGPEAERTRDEPEDRELVRRAAAQAMVLLRNERATNSPPLLPLDPTRWTRIAVIGPNAKRATLEGGGSAHVTPVHTSHPLAALQERLGAAGIEVTHHHGCSIHKRLPPLERAGGGPVQVAWFRRAADALDPSATPQATQPFATTRLMWFTDPLGASAEAELGARLTTTLTPDRSGDWRLSVASVGDATVLVDGEQILDNRDQPIGGGFFGFGRGELVATVPLEAGRTYDIEARLARPVLDNSVTGLHLGADGPDRRDPVDAAADVAAAAEVTIVVVGTNDDWESEGADRESLHLPGRQDELVARVAEACPRTIVVVNAGSPVAMPWLDAVPAVLMAWFGGQELGDALTDILLGTVEPQGRLPVTFPRRLEDTPAFEHHPGRNSVAPYLEKRLMGYRWYDTVGREPLFPFGFGLGYADLGIASARVLDGRWVEATVVNQGTRTGVAVVQVYAHPTEPDRLAEDAPDQQLVGFARVVVPERAAITATIELHERAFQTWDPVRHTWAPTPSPFQLRIGTSSRHTAHVLEVSP